MSSKESTLLLTETITDDQSMANSNFLFETKPLKQGQGKKFVNPCKSKFSANVLSLADYGR